MGALACLFLENDKAKISALGTSLLQLGLTIAAMVLFNPAGGVQLEHNAWWVQPLGISYHVGMDGLSLLMVLLTNALVPLIFLSAFGNKYEQSHKLYALMLVMQSALVGVFTALDGFLFYIFWELALIPIWFICLLWGNGERRIPITLKFFIYTLAGSLLMLIGLIYVYLQTPVPHSFEWQALVATNLSPDAQGWVFWAFFLAFAIKMPLFPFHTWQPDTYVTAPTPGTMLLSGIMLKMGIYGLMRWLLPLAPEGVTTWAPLTCTLAVIGVVHASVIALMQTDLKRLLAYSSMAHVGLIGAGLLAFNFQGLQGATIQMLAHGVNVVALFLVVDILERRYETRHINAFGGIALHEPRFAVLFFVVMLGSIAVPLSNGFIGEFMLLNGLFAFNKALAALAGLSVILGAAYMLRVYQKTMMGENNAAPNDAPLMSKADCYVLLSVALLVLLMGVYPKPILDLAEPAIRQILQVAGR